MENKLELDNLSLIREDLVKSFNQMWGKFPGAVMLIHKTHTIVAQNQKCLELTKGSYCGQRCVTAFPGDHTACKAKSAIKEQTAQTAPFEMMGMKGSSYWVPVDQEPDYFLHFAITTEMAGIVSNG